MAERTEEKKDALRITSQFRQRSGMAYDLKCEGVRLTLLLSPAGPEWRVEARGSRTTIAESTTIEAHGATKLEAIRALGAAWGAASATEHLRVFDWEAVVKVLDSVRALA